MKKCTAGANIAEVCAFGDAELNGEVLMPGVCIAPESVQQEGY